MGKSCYLVGTIVMIPAALNEIFGEWICHLAFCSIWVSFDVMLCSASVLNVCLISIDRYVSITFKAAGIITIVPTNKSVKLNERINILETVRSFLVDITAIKTTLFPTIVIVMIKNKKHPIAILCILFYMGFV
jgi:hypothetical protein